MTLKQVGQSKPDFEGYRLDQKCFQSGEPASSHQLIGIVGSMEAPCRDLIRVLQCVRQGFASKLHEQVSGRTLSQDGSHHRPHIYEGSRGGADGHLSC